MEEKYLTTKEVSEILNISESTVKRYSEYGYIKFVRIKTGHRRYIKESVDNYLIEQNIHASENMGNDVNQSKKKIGKLVAHPHPSHYLMHKYWGRKAHNIVEQYISHFSKPKDKILDPFMGSGVTVIEAIKLKRIAIGVDLNPMSIAIVQNTISKVDLKQFEVEFNFISDRVNEKYAELYQTKCPICETISKLDCAVWENDDIVSVRGTCLSHGKFIKEADDFDKSVYLGSQKRHKEMPKTQYNIIPRDVIPKYVRRSSKNTIDELFCLRAQVILSYIKSEINKVKNEEIKQLLNFTFTSMLANTSKMLPGDPKRATYKSGWVISKFWVPTIHAERNTIDCFHLRFKAILKGKSEISNLHNSVNAIYNADSTKLPLDDNSIDYIFTDPPYGESIAYFSLSQLWNTWLKNNANFKGEIIIDSNRSKDYKDYANRIEKAYFEMFRVLKSGSYLSFTFHNRDLNVWKAIVDACTKSGFEFISAVLQEQAVASGTQGINKKNTLHGDFVYTYRKPIINVQKCTNINYHPDGETLIVNEIHSFLNKNGLTNSSDLYEFLIPLIIKNNSILNKNGEVINLEELLLRNFKYESINDNFKWDLKKRNDDVSKLNVLDLFAGAGGMSSGFSKAGYNIVAAIEYDKRIKETYIGNHPMTKLIIDDIRNVSADKDVKDSSYDMKGIFKSLDKKCDIIIGGPPCQGFSMAGNRIRNGVDFFSDKRNLLFLEYYRMVKALMPKVFIIENVQGILNYNNGKTAEEIKTKFEALGYNVHSELLCAAEYGVPQLRKRAFFIGNKIGLESKNLFPEPTHAPESYIKVWEAIGDLPQLEPGIKLDPFAVKDYKLSESVFQNKMRSNKNLVYNHSSSCPSPKTIEILKLIKPGEGIKDLPKSYHTGSVHSGAYGRMDPNKPSYTITTRLNTPSVGRITHPFKHRTITPREAARIQSFDDSYRFFGNITSLGIQIGNAVPPLLAYNIAKKIKEFLV